VFFIYFLRFVAFVPRSESSIWYSTASPSWRVIPSGRDVLWTNVSLPSSPVRKPKPFMSLYHFTVPFIVCFTVLPILVLWGLVKRRKIKKIADISFYPNICESLFSFFLGAIRGACLYRYLLGEGLGSVLF
jgi:hypothetical protein